MEAAEPQHGAPALAPTVAEFSALPDALMRSSQTPAAGPGGQEGRGPSCPWAEARGLLEAPKRDVRDVNGCAAERMASSPKDAPVDVVTDREALVAKARDNLEYQEALPHGLVEGQARTLTPPELGACPAQEEHLEMVLASSELSSRSELKFRLEPPPLALGTRHAGKKGDACPGASAQASHSPFQEEHPVEPSPLQHAGGGTSRQGEELQGGGGREGLLCPQEDQGLEGQGQEEVGFGEGGSLGDTVCSYGFLGEQEQMGEQVNGTKGGQRQKQEQVQDDGSVTHAKQGDSGGLCGESTGLHCDEQGRTTQGQEDLQCAARRPEEGRAGAGCQSSVGKAVNGTWRQKHQGQPEKLRPEEEEEEAEHRDGATLGRMGQEGDREEGEGHGGPPVLALLSPEVSAPSDLCPEACHAESRVPGTQTELRGAELSAVAPTPTPEHTGHSRQPLSLPSSLPAGGPTDQEAAQDSQQEGPELGAGAASCPGTEAACASSLEASPRTADSAASAPAEASPSPAATSTSTPISSAPTASAPTASAPIASAPTASAPIAIPRRRASLAACSPETARAPFSPASPCPCQASDSLPAARHSFPSAAPTLHPGGSPGAGPQDPLATVPGASQHLRSNSFPGSGRTQLAPDLEGMSLSFSHLELPQRPPKPAIYGSVIPRRDRKGSRDCSVIPESSSSWSALGQDSGEGPSRPDRPSSAPRNSAFAPESPACGFSPPLVVAEMRPYEPPPPAPPEKRHGHPSAVETDGHHSAAVPTPRQRNYPPPVARSSGLHGPPKGPLPEVPDPLVARRYRPLPSTPDSPHRAQTSSLRPRYNKPLPPTPDLLQPHHSSVPDNSARTYRPLPPVPIPEPVTEPPPLPPKSRARNKSIQGALVNSGGQARPRPLGQEWTVSTAPSAGRTSWPPATGRSADSLASTSRSKSVVSPGMAFSNMMSFLSPSSPTASWPLGLQGPTPEPGLAEEPEVPARGSLRRTAPQEEANGPSRAALGQAGQPEKPSHPHLEKASSWPHRREPGRPLQGSGGPVASSDGANRPKGWQRQGLRRPSILPEGSADARGPVIEKSPSPSDAIVFREKKPKEVMGGFSRRCSKLINSSQLLYQEYSDVVLNKEIQSQQRPDSLAEAPGPASPRQPRKALASTESYLQRVSMASRSSLWQEIPVVRNSTVLLSMTHEDQKLQEAKFELIVSEASYLRSLNIAVDHFQHSAQLRAILSNQDQQWLFSRLQDVRDVSATFLSDLEENFENNIFTFHVCDVVLNHASNFRRVYLPYVTNQTYQERTFQNLLNANSSFREVLEKLESHPVCQRLSLKSFLILPFQRITRLKLLLQNILKRTQPGSAEEAEATKAHHALEELIRDCNDNVQSMRRTEELIYLSQKIEFECKIFPLISQSRWLVKSGELTALDFNVSPGLRRKLTSRPVHLHLFNDCLLLSRPREGSRFLVFDHAPFSSIRGEKCEMKLHGAHKNLFRLFLLHNTQGTQAEFLFSTETQSEKLRWISALAMPREELDLLECCDSPQVQCLRAYKPRENDELALEKADVVMVTQQSSDGWLEGVRLSDGERGWFPVQQVEFISNPEVRARNLKEAQRVKTARLQLVEQQA
ncbi:rho guanine nucleotide exchange factor 5 [Saccopteryx bilineata]|uniref:rho guanine nucleotide exchange factor 5 n=1 Tax=Saccopteryx bilineata TaxID=59482 RepID=UPI00339048BF